MNPREHFPDEKATAERLTARFATLWAEQRRLVEERIALESSTAWVWLRRLVRWRQRLAPEGSWRHRALCLLRHGWRLGPGKKVEELTRRIREQGCASAPNEKKTPWVADATLRATTGQSRSPTLTTQSRSLTPGAAKANKLRIAYIGSQLALDAATMRYRAHNLIEALPLVGLEGIFVPQEDVPSQLSAILDHDLIVLVRRIRDDALTTLIGLARRKGLPIVYDIDDYIFDPWVMPYVEAFQDPLGRAKALHLMDELGACLDLCDYFTGSTPYLAERVATLGKKGFVIHNGLNSTQIFRSQLSLEQRNKQRNDLYTHIGYFSGTRTHQADFRVVYPALMRLLYEERSVRLTIVGHLDVEAFPGLAPFMDQIELLPTCDWRELPAAIARVDINIIPLELTPFNEGKSNLKYFEAGLVEVPSVASPTGILCDSITHGHNGLLARTTEEWYGALKELVARPDWRRQMGRNAFEHVMQNYTPAAIGAEAAAVYQQILDLHRFRRDIPKKALKIVLLIDDLQNRHEPTLRQINALAAAGHDITVYLSSHQPGVSTPAVESITHRWISPLLAVQYGGTVPPCDVLLALDPQTRELAQTNQHRARLTIADERLLSMIQGAGRGLELLLREWVEKKPMVYPPSRVA